MAEPKEIRIDFLEGAATYLRRTITPSRLGYCRKHRAPHTGKICYLSIIDLALFRLTGRKEPLDEAWNVALRVAAMLGVDERSGARVFLPGALDHRNAANHAIDSGAAADCLASVILEAGDAQPAEERARLEEAVKACASTYLVDAARIKQIPAQRLWAATGLASAYALLGDERYKEAAIESLVLLLRDGGKDGSIPYFPRFALDGTHRGQADITAYYHSRCIGFSLYILDRLGEEPWPELSAFLEASLEFLMAFYGGNGLKPLLNEAKQWYWESPYEVASHTFDVHALVSGARLFSREDFLEQAASSFRQLDGHRLKDGGIHSHRGKGLNFQCRLFWNAHAAWVARVIEDVPMDEAPTSSPLYGIKAFPEGGLVKVREQGYTAILRGAKQPVNISFGGEVGGGCLTCFGTWEGDFEDRLKIGKWAARVPGSFAIKPAGPSNRAGTLKGFLKENRADIRFRLYIAWLELTGGHPGFAFLYPFRHVFHKLFAEMGGVYASHWDCETTFTSDENEVVFRGAPARRDGTRLEGALEERIYLFERNQILVKTRLELACRFRRLVFFLSPLFQDLTLHPEESAVVLEDRAVFRRKAAPLPIEITYTMPGRSS